MSVLIVIVGALNFTLDLDFIEKAAAASMPTGDDVLRWPGGSNRARSRARFFEP